MASRCCPADGWPTPAGSRATGPDVLVGIGSVSWALGHAPVRPGPSPSRPGSSFGMLGSNGSAAYGDIDTGLAVALMRNRFSPDLTTVARLDQIVAEVIPPAAGPPTTRRMP